MPGWGFGREGEAELVQAALVGRGVHDREGHPAESSLEGAVESLPEEVGHERGVVGEVAAAPGAEYECVMAVGLGNREDLDDPCAHGTGNLPLVERGDVTGVAGGGGHEGDLEGRLEHAMRVVPEDGNIRE